MSDETNASASIAAHSIAACTASPSWLTLPACSASRAASSRLARRDHRPAVDEDLRADLLGDRLAVDRDRAGGGRGDAALQVQPGGVLGRVAVAAPPQDRALLDDVVEPGLADLLGAEVGRMP